MICITFYFVSGKVHSALNCATIEEAFNQCERAGLDALAHPVGTTCGAYSWNPTKEHTLEGFRAKLALCCNDPAEYSRNLISAGICQTRRVSA